MKHKTATQVLEASVEDIKNGKWVCSKLQQVDLRKPNPVEMGCAIGLVSLNSGDTESIKIEDQYDWLVYEFEASHRTKMPEILSVGGKTGNGECIIFGAHRENMSDIIEVARYTDEYSPKEAQEAVEYLWRTIPEEFRFTGKTDIADMQSDVVNYNDQVVKTPKKALKWFEEALTLSKS